MRRHFVNLAFLLVLAAAVQAICVVRAVVPAQDAVRYIAMAQAMETHGVLAVVRASYQEPLYPLSTYRVHQCLQSILGEGSANWILAAQLAAAIPLVLLVLPCYGLMRMLVSRPAALVGGVFLTVLYPIARLGADGLSDSTHLLLLFTAMYLAALAWLQIESHIAAPSTTASGEPDRLRGRWLAVLLLSAGSGLAIGWATLARAEALVLLPAWCLATLYLQPWKAGRAAVTAVSTAGFLAAACCVLGGYLWLAEVNDTTTGMLRLTGRGNPFQEEAVLAPRHDPLQTRQFRTELGERFAFPRKDPETSLRFEGWLAASREFLKELTSGFQHWVGALALLGLASPSLIFRPKLPTRLVGCYWVLYAVVIVVAASLLGYLASRHVLPLVIVGLGYAGEGALMTGSWLAATLAHKHEKRRGGREHVLCTDGTASGTRAAPSRPAVFSLLVIAIAATACLVKTAAPLHAGRKPHRQAGQWLAAQPIPGNVLDTRGWTGLISGRDTYTYESAPLAWADPDLSFVVLEQHELQHDSVRSRTMLQLLESAAERVAVFPASVPAKGVEVYRWYPQRLRIVQRDPSPDRQAN